MTNTYTHKIGKCEVKFEIIRRLDNKTIDSYTLGDIRVIHRECGWDVEENGKRIGWASTRNDAMTEAADAYIADVRLY